MSIDERTRHRLFVKLEAVLGPDDATALMEHLPPVGWADVATKSDLVLLRRDLEVVEHRMMQRIEERLNGQQRALFFSTLGIVMTVVGMTFAR
jgi:hypothetical protein